MTIDHVLEVNFDPDQPALVDRHVIGHVVHPHVHAVKHHVQEEEEKLGKALTKTALCQNPITTVASAFPPRRRCYSTLS